MRGVHRDLRDSYTTSLPLRPVKACPATLDRRLWVLALPLVIGPPNLQNQLTLESEGALNYYGFDRSSQNAFLGGERLEKYNPGKSVCKRD